MHHRNLYDLTLFLTVFLLYKYFIPLVICINQNDLKSYFFSADPRQVWYVVFQCFYFGKCSWRTFIASTLRPSLSLVWPSGPFSIRCSTNLETF